MENLIKEIKMITETFEFGDESGALCIIEALDSDPLLIKDVKFDDRQKNKELVKTLNGLSKYKDKFEDEFPNFARHIYILRGNAR